MIQTLLVLQVSHMLFDLPIQNWKGLLFLFVIFKLFLIVNTNFIQCVLPIHVYYILLFLKIHHQNQFHFLSMSNDLVELEVNVLENILAMILHQFGTLLLLLLFSSFTLFFLPFITQFYTIFQ